MDSKGENEILVGPFQFVTKAPGVAPDQIVPDKHWEDLSAVCQKHGLVPPDLSFDPVTCINTISVCHNSSKLPWYHSSLSIMDAIQQTTASHVE